MPEDRNCGCYERHAASPFIGEELFEGRFGGALLLFVFAFLILFTDCGRRI